MYKIHRLGITKLTNDQANIIGKLIYEEWSTEYDQIVKEAKENGIWKYYGLDTNQYLFKGIRRKAERKLEILNSLVDQNQ